MGIEDGARLRFGFPGKFWEQRARLVLCGPFVGGGLYLYRPHPVEESFGQQHRCCPAQHEGNYVVQRNMRAIAGMGMGAGRAGHRVPCSILCQGRGRRPWQCPNITERPYSGQPGRTGHYMPPVRLVRQDFGAGQSRTKQGKAGDLKEHCAYAPGQTCRTSLSRHFPSMARGGGWPQIRRFFNMVPGYRCVIPPHRLNALSLALRAT